MCATIQHTKARNRTLDLCKLIAACFVVLIHIPFPGDFGSLVSCLARFAVPLFFATAGWYSYRCSLRTIGKRYFHLLGLEAGATALNILCQIFWTVYYGGILPYDLSFSITTLDIRNWILFNANPFRDTLWYLSASAGCYLMLWIYTRIQKKDAASYKALYCFSSLLIIVFFCMDKCHHLLNFPQGFRIYFRNGMGMGLPCFSLGLFLRQYASKLLSALKVRHLVSMLLVGLALSCVEWYLLGYLELYTGSILFTAALLLLTMVHPQLPPRLEKCASLLAPMSTAVYILHPEIIDFYARFVQHKLPPQYLTINEWLMPIFIILLSLLAAGMIAYAGSFLRRKKAAVSGRT